MILKILCKFQIVELKILLICFVSLAANTKKLTFGNIVHSTTETNL